VELLPGDGSVKPSGGATENLSVDPEREWTSKDKTLRERETVQT
jgi:hypothetical protein